MRRTSKGSSVEIAGKPRTGLVGRLLVAYWLLDGIVFGIPVVVLTASAGR